MLHANHATLSTRHAPADRRLAHSCKASSGPDTCRWAWPMWETGTGLRARYRTSPWPGQFVLSDPPTIPLEVPPNPVTPESPAHPIESPPSENPVPVREPPEVKQPVAGGRLLYLAVNRQHQVHCRKFLIAASAFFRWSQAFRLIRLTP